MILQARRQLGTPVGGWSTFQLWELMQTFGEHIHMGLTPSKQPFESNIQFVPKS